MIVFFYDCDAIEKFRSGIGYVNVSWFSEFLEGSQSKKPILQIFGEAAFNLRDGQQGANSDSSVCVDNVMKFPWWSE